MPPFGFFPGNTQLTVSWGDGNVLTYSPNSFPTGAYDLAHSMVTFAESYRVFMRGNDSGAIGGQAVSFVRVPGLLASPIVFTGNGTGEAIAGSPFDDSINGAGGDDLITGGSGADTLLGGAGNDLLAGQSGNDHLLGGVGDDTAIGGSGDDRIVAGAGDDSAEGSNGNDTLFGGDGNDTLFGDGFGFFPEDPSDLDRVTFDDSLVGGAGDDLLLGQQGNDTMIGGEGDDTLRGGPGDDLYNGGPGADDFEVSEGRDLIINDPDDAPDFFYWGSATFNQTRIRGFETGIDQIRLAFLWDVQFHASSNPLTDAPAGTNVFYDTDDGRLFVLLPFGPPAPVPLARFLNAPVLSEADFV